MTQKVSPSNKISFSTHKNSAFESYTQPSTTTTQNVNNNDQNIRNVLTTRKQAFKFISTLFNSNK